MLLERWLAEALRPLFSADGVSYTTKSVAANRRIPAWRMLRLDRRCSTATATSCRDCWRRAIPRPADVPAPLPYYDGSPLQFLAPYQPFPYGISTLALAYNDYKRRQMLQRTGIAAAHSVQRKRGGQPAGNHPRKWGKDESERGRRAELRMNGDIYSPSVDPAELEMPAATVQNTAGASNTVDRDLALYSYQLAAKLYWDAVLEFTQHVRRFPYNLQNLAVHIDDAITYASLMAADHDYLAAGDATAAEKQP